MQVGMLKLAGLKDEGCVQKLSGALTSIKGVENAEVSFAKSKVSITFNENQVSLQRLKVAVEDAGYAIAKPARGEGGACCGACGG